MGIKLDFVHWANCFATSALYAGKFKKPPAYNALYCREIIQRRSASINGQSPLIKMLVFFMLLPLWILANEGWESTKFVWNFGLITACDIGAPENPQDYFKCDPLLALEQYNSVKSGDILWIPPHLIKEFYEKVLPYIQLPFVLVISDGDASFPSDCLEPYQFKELLSHETIIHIFAQNCDYQGDSKKISHIPIGIDFHTVAYKRSTGGWGMMGSPQQQEAYLVHHLQQAPPTSHRKLKAYVDFFHADTMHGEFKRYLQFGEDRAAIFQTILSSGVIDYGPWLRRGNLWEKKREYAFSISPHGNGLDCHRTWEDLALGCIVIVKSSPLNPLYEGLPVVIINHWHEINEENFKKWILQYNDVSTNPSYREKITHQYWITKIKNTAQPYKLYD